MRTEIFSEDLGEMATDSIGKLGLRIDMRWLKAQSPRFNVRLEFEMSVRETSDVPALLFGTLPKATMEKQLVRLVLEPRASQ